MTEARRQRPEPTPDSGWSSKFKVQSSKGFTLGEPRKDTDILQEQTEYGERQIFQPRKGTADHAEFNI